MASLRVVVGGARPLRLSGVGVRVWTTRGAAAVATTAEGDAVAPTAAASRRGAAAAAPKKKLYEHWGDVCVPDRLGKLARYPVEREPPTRDLVNHPHPIKHQLPQPVRFGFVPDRLFQFFYPVTGVTGSYLFFAGLGLFLINKEVWVMTNDMMKRNGILIMYIVLAHKLFGARIADYLYSWDYSDQYGTVDNVDRYLGTQLNFVQVARDVEAARAEHYQAVNDHVFELKRENVALQLEASYRDRLKTVYDEMKRRLDYIAEIEETKRRHQQQHMVSWIVDQVKRSVTPQLENAILKQCVLDIRRLSDKGV